MKFAVMSIDFKRLTLETTFKLAREYGFDGLEIFGSRCHLDPVDFNKKNAARIRALSEKYIVDIPMYTPNALNLPVCICSPSDRERGDGIEYYKRSIDVAAAIGAGRILVVADHPGYYTPRKEVWKYLVESMKEICMYAEGRQVDVTIEPLTPGEGPMISTVDDCVELLSDVSSGNLYAMMDIVPPTVVKEPLSKYFDMLGERLNYIHICNTDGVTDAHFRLERGVLPVLDILDVIKHHGYNGYVTAELYSESFYDPELILANTARFLCGAKKELGL